MDTLISHAITALLGALIAAPVTYLLVTRSKPGRSAAKAAAELKEYQERVANHFARTAGLVDQLTDSYKDVFDQLQAGATDLLDAETLQEKLAHQDGEVITLNRLGYRQPAGTESAESDREPLDAAPEEEREADDKP